MSRLTEYSMWHQLGGDHSEYENTPHSNRLRSGYPTIRIFGFRQSPGMTIIWQCFNKLQSSAKTREHPLWGTNCTIVGVAFSRQCYVNLLTNSLVLLRPRQNSSRAYQRSQSLQNWLSSPYPAILISYLLGNNNRNSRRTLHIRRRTTWGISNETRSPQVHINTLVDRHCGWPLLWATRNDSAFVR